MVVVSESLSAPQKALLGAESEANTDKRSKRRRMFVAESLTAHACKGDPHNPLQPPPPRIGPPVMGGCKAGGGSGLLLPARWRAWALCWRSCWVAGVAGLPAAAGLLSSGPARRVGGTHRLTSSQVVGWTRAKDCYTHSGSKAKQQRTMLRTRQAQQPNVHASLQRQMPSQQCGKDNIGGGTENNR